MARKRRILIDLNIILDVLQKREPFYPASAQVLAGAEMGNIEGYLAAHSLTTLYYLIAKDRSPEIARMSLTDLLQILQVAPVNQDTIIGALSLPYRDFEDAVQMMAAGQIGAEALVTRKTKDFKAGPIPAITPVELLSLP